MSNYLHTNKNHRIFFILTLVTASTLSQSQLLSKTSDMLIEGSSWEFICSFEIIPEDLGETTAVSVLKNPYNNHYFIHAQNINYPAYKGSVDDVEGPSIVSGCWKYTFNRNSGSPKYDGVMVYSKDGAEIEIALRQITESQPNQDPMIGQQLDGVNLDHITTRIDDSTMLNEDNWYFMLQKSTKRIYGHFLNIALVVPIETADKQNRLREYNVQDSANNPGVDLDIQQIEEVKGSNAFALLIKDPSDTTKRLFCWTTVASDLDETVAYSSLTTLDVAGSSSIQYSTNAEIQVGKNKDIHIVVIDKDNDFVDLYAIPNTTPVYRYNFNLPAKHPITNSDFTTPMVFEFFPDSSDLVLIGIDDLIGVIRLSFNSQIFWLRDTNIAEIKSFTVSSDKSKIFSYLNEGGGNRKSYLLKGTETSCHSSCALCTSSAQNHCLACKLNTNYLKDYVAGVGGTCDPCSTGETKSLETCETYTGPCISNCAACTHPTECGTCSVGFVLQSDKTCLDSCDPGYYIDISVSPTVCTQCPTGCTACSNGSTCTACDGSHFLEGNSCETSCSSGYYQNTISRTCDSCASSCTECSTSTTTCTACIGSHFLEGSTCVASCSSGYFQNTGTMTCDSCASPCTECSTSTTTCTACIGSHFLEGTSCEASCSPGYYQNTGTKTCDSCISPCTECSTSTTTCTSCQAGSFLSGSTCTSCGATQTQNPLSGICQDCTSPCQTCHTTSSECQSCESRFYLSGSSCLSCSTDCMGCVDSSTKCTSCDPNHAGGLFYLNGNTCVSSCPAGKFINNGNNQCEVCAAPCTECSGTADTCTSCPSGFEVSGGKCLCASGEFINGSICQKCDGNCKECSGTATSCTICDENFTLNVEDKKCIDNSQLGECPSYCSYCDLPKNICYIELDFSVKLNQYPNEKYDIVLDFYLKETKEKSFNLQDLKELMLKVEAWNYMIEGKEEEKLQEEIFWGKSGIISVGITLPQGLDINKEYALIVKPNSELARKSFKRVLQNSQTTLSTSYIVKGGLNSQNSNTSTAKKLTFYPPPKVSEKEKNTAQKTSQTAAEAVSYTAASAEYISFLSMFFSADPSGLTLKFSQISKLISRLRLINVNFGELLSLFLDGISKGFKEKNLDPDFNLKNSNGFKAKIDIFNLRIFLVNINKFFENGVNLLIYLSSWIFKLVTWCLVSNFKKTKFISEKSVKFIQYQRKIHFIIFNISVVDMSYYGTRTVIHSKFDKENYLNIIFILLCYILYTYDMLDLGWVSASAHYDPEKEMKKIEEQKKFSRVPNTWEEINKKKFIKKVFKDDEVGDGKVISEDKAKILGYVKTINYYKTLANIQEDEVKQKHATSQLQSNPDLYNFSTILLANYFFLLRVLLYHVILVSVPYSPTFQISLLFAVEISYIGVLLKNYIKHKFLSTIHTFISKLLQSFFFMVFLYVSMMISLKFRKKPVTLGYQKIGMYSIILSIIFEYFFLIYGIIYIIVNLVKNRKNKKDKKKIIYYEWILERNNIPSLDDKEEEYESEIGKTGEKMRRKNLFDKGGKKLKMRFRRSKEKNLEERGEEKDLNKKKRKTDDGSKGENLGEFSDFKNFKSKSRKRLERNGIFMRERKSRMNFVYPEERKNRFYRKVEKNKNDPSSDYENEQEE